jgi:hypothetical protein
VPGSCDTWRDGTCGLMCSVRHITVGRGDIGHVVLAQSCVMTSTEGGTVGRAMVKGLLYPMKTNL